MQKSKKHLVGPLILATLTLSVIISLSFVFTAYADDRKALGVLANKVQEVAKCNDALQTEISSAETVTESELADTSDWTYKLLVKQIATTREQIVQIPQTPRKADDKWNEANDLSCKDISGAALESLKNTKDQVLANITNSEKGTSSAKKSAENNENMQKLTEIARQNSQINTSQQRELQKLALPKCNQISWQTADETVYTGCERPLAGDGEYEWKSWEQALQDGDICVSENSVTGTKTAYECNE